MWRQLAIFLTLCSLAAGILDMTHICKDKRNDEMVSSPFDCQAYFICNTVPQLQYCTEGLHFDNERKLCNLPIDAKCVIQTINTENVGEVNNAVENVENTTENKNENEVEVDAANNSDSDKDTPQAIDTSDNNNNDINGDIVNSNIETEEHSHSIFVAFDIANGQAIDPMTDYDTNHIVCRHFGAYFLPHPTNCRKYFICAYGHLHEHHCGRGTLWNYKRMECEISSEAQCFSGSEENTRTTWEELSTTTPTTDWTRTTTPSTTLTTPIYTLTTCIPIYTTYSTPPNTTPTLPSTEPTPTVIITTETWTPMTTERPTTFGTTERPTTFETTERPTTFETTERPTTFVTTERPTTFVTTERPTTFETTERPTTVVTTNGIPSWTTQKPRDDVNAEQTIKCPSSRQAYLPHPKDCNKYFICILDMPILTSCPSGLYWDQNAEFCDTAENVHCFQK